MVMKKIFDGVFDEEIHSDFLKYGRGDYKNKFMIEGKKQASKWAIKTGPEFVNGLVARCLDRVSGTVKFKGAIITTTDIKDEIDFEVVKFSNFQGIRTIKIDTEIPIETIKGLMEKYPRAFFPLTFKGDDFALKVKAKSPKSGKPGKGDEEGPKVEFLSLKTTNGEIVEELFFGVGDFKEIRVAHDIHVTDIVYPKDMESLSPAEVREKSKRKGHIVRRVKVDGTEKSSEAEFVA